MKQATETRSKKKQKLEEEEKKRSEERTVNSMLKMAEDVRKD